MPKDTSIGESFAVAGITSVLAAVFVAGAMVLMIPAYIIHGWIITLIWAWFVVPYFHVSPIHIPVAIGFEMLVLMLRPVHFTNTKDSKWWSIWVTVYISPFLVLLVAYVAHQYT